MAAKPRLNLELDVQTKKRLDMLKVKTNASSLTEVIRNALHRYELVLVKGAKVTRNGREVVLIHGGD